MEQQIKREDLEVWLVDYIYNEVSHTFTEERSERTQEFNNWALNYDRKDAETLVKMEILDYCPNSSQAFVSIEEATEIAKSLLEIVYANWYR